MPNSTRPTATKVVQTNVNIDTEVVSFSFGVQAGNGGVFLENSSSVRGNVYSNGPVTGQNNNIVRGTVVSAGPAGLIDGAYATSSGYARTIRDSTLDGERILSNDFQYDRRRDSIPRERRPADDDTPNFGRAR